LTSTQPFEAISAIFRYPYGGSYVRRAKPLIRQSLRQPRLRELLRPSILLQLLELPFSLLLVIQRLQPAVFCGSGRSPDWLKMVTREAEEDWAR